MSGRLKLAVLASGNGSNLQALIAAAQQQDFPAELSVVVSNVPDARALERARQAGVETAVVDHRDFADRRAFDRALLEVLHRHGVERVCLAGFMRLLGAEFLRAFPDGVLNIHPALLPAFPGLHSQRQALEHGVKITGCTVHFVDEGTDTGPIVGQAAVPVLPGDDEASLSGRILAEEHRLYPLCVRKWCEGAVKRKGRQVELLGCAFSGDAVMRNPGG